MKHPPGLSVRAQLHMTFGCLQAFEPEGWLGVLYSKIWRGSTNWEKYPNTSNTLPSNWPTDRLRGCALCSAPSITLHFFQGGRYCKVPAKRPTTKLRYSAPSFLDIVAREGTTRLRKAVTISTFHLEVVQAGV